MHRYQCLLRIRFTRCRIEPFFNVTIIELTKNGFPALSSFARRCSSDCLPIRIALDGERLYLPWPTRVPYSNPSSSFNSATAAFYTMSKMYPLHENCHANSPLRSHRQITSSFHLFILTSLLPLTRYISMLNSSPHHFISSVPSTRRRCLFLPHRSINQQQPNVSGLSRVAHPSSIDGFSN